MRFSDFGKQAEQNVKEGIPDLSKVLGPGVRQKPGAGRVGQQMGADPKMQKINQKVGATAVKQPMGSSGNKMAKKVGAQANKMLAQQMLKKGATIPITTTDGNSPEDFKIDNVKGDEVTMVNPKPKKGEPTKTVHSKKELEPIIKGLAGV